MEDKKLDRRMVRSRRQMQAALLELIKEKEYRRISVADIADKAEVSRPTFYSHFKTRDDLLLSCFDRTFEQFFEELQDFVEKEFDGNPQGAEYSRRVISRIFELWAEEKEMIRLLLQTGTESLVLSRFREYTMLSFQMHFQLSQREDVSDEVMHLLVELQAGIIMNLLRYWMDHDLQLPPATMGLIYEKLFYPGINRAVEDGSISELLDS